MYQTSSEVNPKAAGVLVFEAAEALVKTKKEVTKRPMRPGTESGGILIMGKVYNKSL